MLSKKRTEAENAELLAIICALQSEHAMTQAPIGFDTDSVLICIDTGASRTAPFDKTKFVKIKPLQGIRRISSSLQVEGVGIVKWKLTSNAGDELEIYITGALYIPQLPTRLLAPQHLAFQIGGPNDGFMALARHGVMRIGEHRFPIQYSIKNNLPMLRTTPGITKLRANNNELEQPTLMPSGTENDQGIVKYNMSKIQREFLFLHKRLGHMFFQHMQKLVRLDKIPKKFSNVSIPRCRECLEAVQTMRPVDALPKNIKANDLTPGECFLVDQLQSGTLGFVPTWKGKPTKRKYGAAIVFVDHASKWIFINLNESTGSEEALKAKLCFEREI